MLAPYSLTQVVTDGPLTTWRWMHHVVKILTAAAASFGFYVVPSLVSFGHMPRMSLVWACVLGGPVVWCLGAIYEHLRPSDLQPLTEWQHVADWLNDASLSSVPLAIALMADDNRLGALLAVLIIALWAKCHPDARP